jgi:hypothetical protein
MLFWGRAGEENGEDIDADKKQDQSAELTGRSAGRAPDSRRDAGATVLWWRRTGGTPAPTFRVCIGIVNCDMVEG